MSIRPPVGLARPTLVCRAGVLAVVAAAACGTEAGQPPPPDAAPRSDAPAAASLNLDSVAAVQRAESLATAIGRWNESEVVSRLEAAGLVVRDLDRPVRAAGFSPEGRTLAVSGGELVVFIYADAASRIADTRALDSASAAPAGLPGAWAGSPRLITSGNLAAVLLTEREQLAERVRNVLTARHGG